MKCPTTYAWENDLVQKFKSENNSASFKYQQFYLMKGANLSEEEGWGLYFQRNKE